MNGGVPEQISVFGAGSWGTAVALALAHQGHHVLLWARDAVHVQHMQRHQCNEKYLPNVSFPSNLSVTTHFEDALNTKNLLIAVPSNAFTDILKDIKTLPHEGIAWLTKGLEPASHRLFSDIIIDNYGKTTPMALISGPSFASEVAMQKPTALVVAGTTPVICKHWQKLLHSEVNRVYTSDDIIGVQLCGAVKNVLAIACGISDGLEFGANSRAALITRGIAEMTLLGRALGADEATFHGLAGLGDLVLTCTDNQSRNRRFGLLIGKGYSIELATEEVQQVVEGLHNAKQVYQLAEQYHVDMPISRAVYQVLENKVSPSQAANALLQRPI